ncbi:MAG TPA: endonuclease/exonuclease/phosphatase family protein [Methanothrix sp.]|nr:endonuclease/exonuclease/phosphatase family protein [Methanothrix sp.]HQJ78911.1 endonuclease/exonuclease/phosphatase family protein [Methanothrix sp.]
MTTLLGLKEKFVPSNESLGCREYARIFGLVSNRAVAAGPLPAISLRQLLNSGERYEEVLYEPFTIFVQNTALLPPVTLKYKGVNRDGAIQSIIDNLRIIQPNVVGLTEIFIDSEKKKIKEDLSTIYPYTREGPDEIDIEQDGGLLLLSRHPILDSHQTIFRQSSGWDMLSNKGVLHAHIELQGHPIGYDIFLAHTQDPDAGGDAKETLKEQLTHLNSFIQACRSPYCPALLMGDLNVNGFDTELYNDMVSRFEYPVDVWGSASTNGIGITWDSGADGFSREHSPVTDESKRHKTGQRLDYIFCWHEECLLQPVWRDAEVVVWTSDPGREISDHYGLLVQQQYLMRRAFAPSPFGIGLVDAAFRQFHCLNETMGSIVAVSSAVDSDDIEFKLRYFTANGASGEVDINPKKNGYSSIGSGDIHYFEVASALEFKGDPGDYLDIEVVGYEVDEGLGIETGCVTLGPTRKRILREAYPLFRDLKAKVVLLITGDNGEYAITVELFIH